jgi:hypothetical protein
VGTGSKILRSVCAGDYLHAVEAGTSPDRAELLKQHPDLAAELGSFFRNRDAVERIAVPIKEQLPALAETIGPSESRAGAGAGTTIRYFGDYELLEEIARGRNAQNHDVRRMTMPETPSSSTREQRLERILAVAEPILSWLPTLRQATRQTLR